MKDRVVCVNVYGLDPSDNNPELNEIYEVTGAKSCSCGVRLLSIGLAIPCRNTIGCTTCGAQISHNGDRWLYAYRFRSVDESFGEWVEETIMKEVVYEEALTQK